MSRFAAALKKKEETRPSLALAMIVKNEAATLEKCLRTAAPHVDEIVIVDTGSSDGTRAIAKKWADVYDEIEWPDSFSKARNHSLSLVSSDYFIFLDGDEYIDDPAGWRRIRNALDLDTVAGLTIKVRNDLGKNALISSRVTWLERVIVRDPDVYFQGRVHNQITPSLKRYMGRTGTKCVRVDAEGYHVGYSYDREKMKKKYAPRLKLLRAEVEEATGAAKKAYYVYQLGVVLHVMGKPHEVLRLYEEVDLEPMTPDNAYHFLLVGAQAGLSAHKPEKVLAFAEHLIDRRPREPVGYFAAANALMQMNRHDDGMLMLLEVFEMNQEEKDTSEFALNDARLLRVIGSVCSNAGHSRLAAAFHAMSQEDSYNEKVARYLIRQIKTAIVNPQRQPA